MTPAVNPARVSTKNDENPWLVMNFVKMEKEKEKKGREQGR